MPTPGSAGDAQTIAGREHQGIKSVNPRSMGRHTPNEVDQSP
ncbi:hypothetical protein BJ956_000074 [Arthrobacter psychrochitiniphilus]|nr:hypothetical protein [Arthrobacter sp. lap29]NYG15555.1 hypothetical protein [Arthrobacter psychrochitiniphilus]